MAEKQETPIAEAESAEELRKFTRAWHAERQRYPGWLITPRVNRDRLWEGTVEYSAPVLRAIEDLQVHERLAFLFEWVWRLEHCLVLKQANPVGFFGPSARAGGRAAAIGRHGWRFEFSFGH
jgi:hypothetical protein